jgi:8-oxo-dGTP diphosphatase
MKVNQVAVGVIRDKCGNFCITKRKSGKHLEGYWEFPGGKVEQDESVENALIRELKEEVGISVRQFKLIDVIKFDYEIKIVELHFYLITDYDGVIVANEDQALKLVCQCELFKYKLPEANYQVIDKLL